MEPTVVKKPRNSVAVNTKLKGEAGAAAPEVPPADAIQRQVSDMVGTTVMASISNVVKGPQSTMPVSMPTPTPTAPMKTVTAPENSADDAKGQDPSTLLARALATLVAVLLDVA